MAASRLSKNPTTRKSAQTFLLVWVDVTVHSGTVDTKNTLEKLRAIVPDVQLIDRPDKAIDLLKNTDTETSFVITSGTCGQELVPRIHSFDHLDTIYIFCQNGEFHSEWSKAWTKVIGVNNDIDSICEALKQAVKPWNQDNIPMVILDAGDSNNMNKLPPSFMYTTLLKDALLKMKHDLDQEMRKFYDNVLRKYALKSINRSELDRFRSDYRPNHSVQWYTGATFVYPVMNDGLRYLQGDIIVDMGFFIHDLHHQLAQLQQQQVEPLGSKKFKVYRGQGLTQQDLQNLKEKRGGLLGFNNFLSTSLKREVSFLFAESSASKPGGVGILFKMLIDPRVSKTPFADISSISEFPEEAEVLFGMHTVFRIGNIQQIGHTTIYEIELELTADDDPQLTRLTKHVGENILAGWTWHRVGWILESMNQLDKAEDIYLDLLMENPDTRDKGVYNHQLGLIHAKRGTHQTALDYYQTSLGFKKQVLSEDDPSPATSYNNIGLVYDNMGEYAKALSYYEKSLAILQKTLPETHPSLATSCNNIGLLYDKMGEYPKALSYYEKSLVIREETLPETHPNLATSYNNIGLVYDSMGEYAKALSYYEKCLAIREKTLPETHPHLAMSYNNIGVVYDKMGEYPKALSYYEKSLAIRQKTLPETHPDLAPAYNNIGYVYDEMGEYPKALSHHEKSLAIRENTLPETHPDLACSYKNMGSAYNGLGEYSKALELLDRALKIFSKTLPSTHTLFAEVYRNMAQVYRNMNDYGRALKYFEKAQDIWRQALPATHPDLAKVKNWIEEMQAKI